MKLKLHNILKIEDADIEIGGLTVLTGENNSGKSTVGKILFSILKAVNNVRQVDKMKTISLIRTELISLKRMFHRSEDTSILDDIQNLSLNIVDKLIDVNNLRQNLEIEAERRNFSSRMVAMIRSRLYRIEALIVKLDNPEVAVRDEFESIAKSEFMETLNSYGSMNSTILFHDDTTDADGSDIEISLYDGKVDYVRLWGNSSLEDVTYIESPLYLHILNTLRLTSSIPTTSLRGLPSYLRRENIPYHLADMADKILSSSDELSDLFNHDLFGTDYSSQLDEINSVIGGEFILNNKTKQLSFKENGHVVPPISVASGIKSFGVLQRLIQTDNISTFKMLIWDEPEIHLHPEWQIVFCKLIIELVAKGIPIVVSSHSPYFVQALRYFASAKGIEKDVKYYMAEESNETRLSTVKEVTNDLNRVFALLAAPLRDIMNVDAVRNSMK
ncbi:AAA family ATPase [Bacteroides acidifaciens]|uniref:AAA family ATPase n=1 Tax=Bacteroides acidifaciens TaxID=85831 RepID=UPI002557E6B8|nr:AAA family ATPase [Bacteroides acidifaciens]